MSTFLRCGSCERVYDSRFALERLLENEGACLACGVAIPGIDWGRWLGPSRDGGRTRGLAPAPSRRAGRKKSADSEPVGEKDKEEEKEEAEEVEDELEEEDLEDEEEDEEEGEDEDVDDLLDEEDEEEEEEEEDEEEDEDEDDEDDFDFGDEDDRD